LPCREKNTERSEVTARWRRRMNVITGLQQRAPSVPKGSGAGAIARPAVRRVRRPWPLAPAALARPRGCYIAQRQDANGEKESVRGGCAVTTVGGAREWARRVGDGDVVRVVGGGGRSGGVAHRLVRFVCYVNGGCLMIRRRLSSYGLDVLIHPGHSSITCA